MSIIYAPVRTNNLPDYYTADTSMFTPDEDIKEVKSNEMLLMDIAYGIFDRTVTFHGAVHYLRGADRRLLADYKTFLDQHVYITAQALEWESEVAPRDFDSRAKLVFDDWVEQNGISNARVFIRYKGKALISYTYEEDYYIYYEGRRYANRTSEDIEPYLYYLFATDYQPTTYSELLSVVCGVYHYRYVAQVAQEFVTDKLPVDKQAAMRYVSTPSSARPNYTSFENMLDQVLNTIDALKDYPALLEYVDAYIRTFLFNVGTRPFEIQFGNDITQYTIPMEDIAEHIFHADSFDTALIDSTGKTVLTLTDYMGDVADEARDVNFYIATLVERGVVLSPQAESEFERFKDEYEILS